MDPNETSSGNTASGQTAKNAVEVSLHLETYLMTSQWTLTYPVSVLQCLVLAQQRHSPVTIVTMIVQGL